MDVIKKLGTATFIIFDVSDYKPEPEKPEPVYTKQVKTGSNEYEVWIEGFAATGQSQKAFQLNLTHDTSTKWKGNSFREACINAMTSLEWDMAHYYNYENNSYWACRFFDNEKDARKSFG